MKTNSKRTFTLAPRATEKTYAEQSKRTYVFNVPNDASKQLVKELVEGVYGVTVTDVRTLIRKGKPTRFSRGKHAYPGTTYRQNKKYAYVTLKEGDKIKIEAFEEEEEPKKEKDAKKSAKAAEKEAKAAEKAAKKAEKAEKKGDK